MKYRKALDDLLVYETGKPIEEVLREHNINIPIIKLASNENPFGTSKKVIEKLKNINQMNIYPDGNCYYLKEELSKFYDLAEQYFIIGNGSDEITNFIANSFLDKEFSAVMAKPSFIRYLMVTQLMNARAIEVKSKDDFKYDYKKIIESVQEDTSVVFIANPDNPTGSYLNKHEIDEIVNNIREDVLIIIDEAYYEYVEKDDYPDTLEYIKKGKKNVGILRTFSKIYGLAGLRIGYGIFHPDVIKLLNKVRPPFNVNTVAQIAAIEALKDQDFIRYCKFENNKNIKNLKNDLKRLDFKVYDSITNFLLVDIKRDCIKFCQELMKKGIILRPMKGYGLDNFVRITCATEKENEILINKIKEIL